MIGVLPSWGADDPPRKSALFTLPDGRVGVDKLHEPVPNSLIVRYRRMRMAAAEQEVIDRNEGDFHFAFRLCLLYDFLHLASPHVRGPQDDIGIRVSCSKALNEAYVCSLVVRVEFVSRLPSLAWIERGGKIIRS
jgi:hypothetical protein